MNVLISFNSAGESAKAVKGSVNEQSASRDFLFFLSFFVVAVKCFPCRAEICRFEVKNKSNDAPEAAKLLLRL